MGVDLRVDLEQNCFNIPNPRESKPRLPYKKKAFCEELQSKRKYNRDFGNRDKYHRRRKASFDSAASHFSVRRYFLPDSMQKEDLWSAYFDQSQNKPAHARRRKKKRGYSFRQYL